MHKRLTKAPKQKPDQAKIFKKGNICTGTEKSKVCEKVLIVVEIIWEGLC